MDPETAKTPAGFRLDVGLPVRDGRGSLAGLAAKVGCVDKNQ